MKDDKWLVIVRDRNAIATRVCVWIFSAEVQNPDWVCLGVKCLNITVIFFSTMNFISHLIVGFQGQSGNRHGNRGRKQAKKAASTDLGAGEAGMSLRGNWMWFHKLLTSSTVFKQKGAFCFLKSCPICYKKWCCLLYRALKIHSFVLFQISECS